MSARQGEERGRGIPRTEEERRARHEELYPGTELPERGYGLTRISGSSTPFIVGGLAIIALIALALVRRR